tara:strand:- start:947 stop:1822 length:876 start_codon:yes stop_codon:yes gene_type:complete
MANENTDNLSKSPEMNDFNIDSPENNTPDTADDFFEALDRKVNQGILEPEEEPALMQNETEPETSEVSPETESQEHNWEKRYSDSSSEAKRLNSRLSELEPYVPVLDAMRKDPNLVTHVRDYFEGGGSTPKKVTEKLGLDDDFIFDADEAVNNTDSDSAKVLQATIDGVVNQRLQKHQVEQENQSKRLSTEAEFRAKHKMNDGEWKELVDYANSRTLSLDDIYYLKNRENRDKNVADSARKDMSEQMKRVRQKPQSASSIGGATRSDDMTPDEQVFEAILGIDSELESVFG